MLAKLTNGFVAFMTRPRKPRGACNYGICVTDYLPEETTIFLTFTFQSGQRYCCSASGCHHGLLFDFDYQRLRDCFREAGVDVPKPMRIQMTIVWERGALFALVPGDRKTEYEAITGEHTSEEVYDERQAENSSTQS